MVQLKGKMIEHLFDDVIQLRRLKRDFARLGELEQSANDRFDLFHIMQDGTLQRLPLGARHALTQQLRLHLERRQRIADVVRHAGREQSREAKLF